MHSYFAVDCVWNVMAHAQKPDFVFRRNGRVHLNRQGRLFSRLLAAEFCASAVVMLDTPSSEVVWRVLDTHSICQFPLHFHSHASPCVITFQLDSTKSLPSSSSDQNLSSSRNFCAWWGKPRNTRECLQPSVRPKRTTGHKISLLKSNQRGFVEVLRHSGGATTLLSFSLTIQCVGFVVMWPQGIGGLQEANDLYFKHQ